MKGAAGPITALAAAVRRRLWLARATLLWERLWPALWPPTAVAGLFVGLALFGVWAWMPGWLHVALLALFTAAFVGGLVRGLRHLRLPDESEAVRRLERASDLAHRPLGTLHDRPASAANDRLAQALWQAHLARTAHAARRLRVGLAAPGLARRDPLALRAALLLVLVIAVAGAGGDAGPRLARAVSPDLSGAGTAGPAALTLWITPPAYTGEAPVSLAAGSTASAAKQPTVVSVPRGSKALARVHGGRGMPRLVVGDETVAFETVDSANYEVEAELTKGDRLAVVQDGDELGAWPLSVIADQPPQIAFARPPSRTRRASLRLDYTAEDDYGLASVELTIALADQPDRALSRDLALPKAGATKVEETSFHDFTAHPWAGLPVTVTLEAVDARGQTGTSGSVRMALPERVFNHPVARAIVEQRKTLALDPSKRAEVGRALDDLARRPQHFFDDLSVFLGLRSARARLFYDDSEQAIAEVQDLLWDLALAVEEGPLAFAERELRDIQDKLLEALDRGASDEEIERLLDELRTAMKKFFDALVEQAMEQRDAEPMLEQQMTRLMQPEDLLDAVERARELYRTGARDAARELLSRLREALENLRAGRFAGADPQSMSQGEAALRELEQLIQRQQELLDQTFRWSQGAGEMAREGGARKGHGRQERLRHSLGDVMLQWGETGMSIPHPLGRAERAMRDAGEALEQSLPGQAVGPQTDAIEQLQKGGQAMLDALLERYGQGRGRQGQQPGPFSGRRDPLGRGFLGRGYRDDGSVKVPEEAEIQRSREILEELYRRAGDLDRSPLERNYLRRLLRRF